MFKLVVSFAIFASVAAEPSGSFYSLPITQYSSILSPATTTIAQQATSVVHPSPTNYYSTAPLAYSHFIKKRSVPLSLGYIAPSTYIASPPYVPASYIAGAPLIKTSIVPSVAPISPVVHLIKKRSAPLLHTTYIAPATYPVAPAPILTTYNSASYIPSTQFVSQPITYTQFIKK